MNIDEYILKNNKATYYRVAENLKVKFIEPSYVFELLYFKNFDLLNEQLKDVVIEKDKKIKRCANLDLKTLEERLFRSLVNKDKYHTVDLANELFKRDRKKLMEILYKLSFLSEDENKLIKTYMFEYLTEKIGYNEYILKNVIVYFIKSYNKYMDFNDDRQLEYFSLDRSRLYKYIYDEKLNLRDKLGIKNLNINTTKSSKFKEYIYEKIKG